MIMILGIIGWVTLYGLTTTVLLGLPEFNAISPYRFAWPQGLMYLLFGLLCGTLITLRAPSRGVLHTVVSTILFGLIWFRFEIIDYYAYFLLLFTAALSAALVSARWTRSS